MNALHTKKRGRLKAAFLVSVVAVLLVFTSCRKGLCYEHDEHALTVKTEVQPQWMQEWENPYRGDSYGLNWKQIWETRNWPGDYNDFRPAVPNGIRCVIRTEGSRLISSNLKEIGGALNMPPGRHELLFYNNDTEYIVFEHTDQPTLTTASTRPRSRAGYQAPQGHENERTISPPDMLYASYVPQYEAGLSLKPDQLSVTMFPRTYSYLIRYRFKSGLEYVAQAKGALTGMADKAYLHDGHTDATPATLLFDCKVDDIGCTAKVMSFGVPDFAYKLNEYTDNPAKLHFVLNLEVMLKNGKRLNYNLDVSDIMRAQPRGGILLFSDIEVSDKDGNENTGGFDPDVGDWEDVIDIPLPID